MNTKNKTWLLLSLVLLSSSFIAGQTAALLVLAMR